MNSDFRLAVDFPDHPKTRKLIKGARALVEDLPRESLLELASEAAAFRLVGLLAWTASNRSESGDLSDLSDPELETRMGWKGPPGLVKVLHEAGYLEGRPHRRRVHEWSLHNGWCSGSKRRSESAKKNAAKRWSKGVRKGSQNSSRTGVGVSTVEGVFGGKNGVAEPNTAMRAHIQAVDAPSPSPSPSQHTQITTEKEKPAPDRKSTDRVAAITVLLAFFGKEHEAALHCPYIAAFARDRKILGALYDQLGEARVHEMIEGFFKARAENRTFNPLAGAKPDIPGFLNAVPNLNARWAWDSPIVRKEPHHARSEPREHTNGTPGGAAESPLRDLLEDPLTRALPGMGVRPPGDPN